MAHAVLALLLLPGVLKAVAAYSRSTPYGTVQVDAWGNNSVRIRIAPAGSPIVDPPVMALLSTPPVSPTERRAAVNQFVHGNLVLSIGSEGYIKATRESDGATLLEQTLGSWGTPAPGSRALSVSATVEFGGLQSGERLYGMGEHADGVVGRTSFSTAWHSDNNGNVFIPFYTSSLGYAFLWNLPGYGTLNASQANVQWHANATQNVDFWLATTPVGSSNALADLLSEYADAVGHAPAMPSYATGFIQSKNRYRNQTQLLAVAAGYAQRGLPLSVIVIDYLSWVTLGDWTFNPACWPDPQGMVNTLKGQGVELMVSFYPYQVPGSSHYDEFMSKKLLNTNLTGGYGTPFGGCLGGTYVYDASSEAARNATFQVL
jgi:alpha-D-xyloside xylohydrolase